MTKPGTARMIATRPWEPAQRTLTWLGSAASFAAGLLLCLSAVASLLRAGEVGAETALLRDNWLILIFKIHAAWAGTTPEQLAALVVTDFLLLGLTGVTALALAAAYWRRGRLLLVLAALLPFAGCILYAVTQLAGRCSVMASVLLVSLVMLKAGRREGASALLGLASAVFLLLGDFTVGLSSPVITLLFGSGYLLLPLWFFIIGARLAGRAAQAGAS
jgi:hypothetical protein